MRWERRRPVWPLVAGLACLFALAVAAPYCWQHPVLNVHELIERRQQEHSPPSLPTRPAFDLDTLRGMHAALRKLVDVEVRLPQVSGPAKPRVIVTSEGERLAMLDRRPHQPPQKLAESLKPVTLQASEPLLRQAPGLLIQRLETLATQPLATEWSNAVLGRIRQLTDNPTISRAMGLQIVNELRQLASAGHIRSLEITDPAIQQNWLQAAQGLQRRVSIWELFIERGDSEVVTTNASADIMPVLTTVAAHLAGTANGERWRDYLLLDQLATASSEGVQSDVVHRIRLGQEVLSRLNDPRLTDEQRTFVATEPMAGLSRELRSWAAGPVDLEKLLAIVEHYEADGKMLYGSAVAQLIQRMAWSTDVKVQNVAKDLQQQFRGTNMRIALSHEMFNRMIPQQPRVISPVHERIAGTKVDGRSQTTSEVDIRLLPTDDAWRIGLRAAGRVFSNTRSDTWPVKVRNAARYEYEAEKIITIGQNGLEIAPTEAKARGRHEFLGAESEFDRVPFMGALFRNFAKKENQKSRPQAMSQVKSRVIHKAESRMDNEADAKLHRLEAKFRDHVLMPFGQLALAAEPVDMFTTTDRAVMQLRLANLGQLAAHTPRPSAPADSLASMQLHESALNNALAGLGLEGRRLTLPELHEFLAEKFGQSDVQPDEELPRRARIEFARHDAIHVSFVEDRLELILNFRELGHGRDKIQNFQVHAYYRPQLNGLQVNLVRDDTLQFSGRHLKTGARVVLHSVMGKLFAKGQQIPIIKKSIEADPRLNGLMVTQLVINDGWMAMALGPAAENRTAWRTPNYSLESEWVK